MKFTIFLLMWDQIWRMKFHKFQILLQRNLKIEKQYVFNNGENSDLKHISCGVPQGSVL